MPMLQRCLVTQLLLEEIIYMGTALGLSLHRAEEFMWLRKTYALLEVVSSLCPPSLYSGPRFLSDWACRENDICATNIRRPCPQKHEWQLLTPKPRRIRENNPHERPAAHASSADQTDIPAEGPVNSGLGPSGPLQNPLSQVHGDTTRFYHVSNFTESRLKTIPLFSLTYRKTTELIKCRFLTHLD